jgi:hypothetical protein
MAKHNDYLDLVLIDILIQMMNGVKVEDCKVRVKKKYFKDFLNET